SEASGSRTRLAGRVREANSQATAKRSPSPRSLARGQDVSVPAEAQASAGRRRQVVLAAGDVRAAVDDRDADGAPVVAQRHPGAARQALVGDAERARRQAAAAGKVAAVEAR